MGIKGKKWVSRRRKVVDIEYYYKILKDAIEVLEKAYDSKDVGIMHSHLASALGKLDALELILKVDIGE